MLHKSAVFIKSQLLMRLCDVVLVVSPHNHPHESLMDLIWIRFMTRTMHHARAYYNNYEMAPEAMLIPFNKALLLAIPGKNSVSIGIVNALPFQVQIGFSNVKHCSLLPLETAKIELKLLNGGTFFMIVGKGS